MGLRYGFGVTAVCTGIPLNLVQRRLGHSQLTMTAIYADAVRAGEKDIAGWILSVMCTCARSAMLRTCQLLNLPRPLSCPSDCQKLPATG